MAVHHRARSPPQVFSSLPGEPVARVHFESQKHPLTMTAIPVSASTSLQLSSWCSSTKQSSMLSRSLSFS